MLCSPCAAVASMDPRERGRGEGLQAHAPKKCGATNAKGSRKVLRFGMDAAGNTKVEVPRRCGLGLGSGFSYVGPVYLAHVPAAYTG